MPVKRAGRPAGGDGRRVGSGQPGRRRHHRHRQHPTGPASGRAAAGLGRGPSSARRGSPPVRVPHRGLRIVVLGRGGVAGRHPPPSGRRGTPGGRRLGGGHTRFVQSITSLRCVFGFDLNPRQATCGRPRRWLRSCGETPAGPVASRAQVGRVPGCCVHGRRPMLVGTRWHPPADRGRRRHDLALRGSTPRRRTSSAGIPRPVLTPRAAAPHHGRVSAQTFAYPHCPFREVTHAAARRAPLARRLAVILWPSARRAEHVELTTAGIAARGLFGGVEMRWSEIAGARPGRTLSGRRRLIVQTRDARRLEVASTLPGFDRLCTELARRIAP